MKHSTKKRYRIIGGLLLICMMIQLIPALPAEAAGIKIYNYTTGKTTTYTGKQVAYICNGIKVSLPGTPGIIENGVALGSYEDIFQNTYEMNCSLSKDGKKLTINYHNNTLVLTFGSKKAVLNGKEQTMSVAPVKIKYAANGSIKYLVPTRFVAESMGLRYSWNSSTSTVTMTRSITLNYNGTSVPYSGLYCNASFHGNVFESKTAPNVIFANTAMVHAYEFFKKIVGVDFLYSEEDGTVSFSKGDISLEMMIGSTVVYINGQVADCGVAPEFVLYEETGEQAVLVPAYFVAKALGYDYEWDGTTKTAIITETNSTGSSEEVTIPEESGSIDDSLESLEPAGTPNTDPAEEFVYFDWKASDTKENFILNQESISGTSVNNSAYLNTIYKDTMQSDLEKETYYINFTSPVYQVENLGFDENDLLVLSFPNVLSSSRFYNLNGTLISHIATGNTEDGGHAEVKLQLASDRLSYDFHFSEDHQNLILTVYNNFLTGITAGKTENGTNFIRFRGSFPLNAEVIDLDNLIMIEFPYTVNWLSESGYYYPETSMLSSAILSSPQINYCQFVINKTETGLILKTESDAEENTFTLYLSKSGQENPDSTPPPVTVTPVPDNQGQESAKPSEPISPKDENFGNGQRYLSIDIPAEVEMTDIKDEDRYYNRQIVLRFPGEFIEFYEEHPIRNICDIVSSIQVNANNGETVITITTDKVQAYFLEYGEDYIHLVMDVPSKFYDKIVVLDAGHGGTDPGAVKNGVNEKDLNFKIMNQYVNEYFANSDIKVYYTRTTDILIDLYDRADYPTELDADLFVSLHMNSSTSSLSNGTGVYYSTLNSSVNESGLTSSKMANIFAQALSSAINTKNNGALTANFVVIRETKVPAVLIELGFLTNTADFKKLTNETYQKKAAKAIYNTISSLFETYPTSR